MEVNKRSPIPVYYQLKQIIIDRIKSGEWPPGSIISSEREFSEIFKVSRMTIRQAMNELVNEGILYREKGRGTFVSQPRVEQHDIMSFTEAATNKGLEASTEVKVFEIRTPDIYILEKLNLQDYEDVFYIQRKRMIGSLIIGIEQIYLPVRYCSNLESMDLSGSLYRILKENYGYTIEQIKTSLEAITPKKDILNLFQVNETVPILKVTGVNITDTNLKLFYEESVYRSDKYVLNVSIYKK